VNKDEYILTHARDGRKGELVYHYEQYVRKLLSYGLSQVVVNNDM